MIFYGRTDECAGELKVELSDILTDVFEWKDLKRGKKGENRGKCSPVVSIRGIQETTNFSSHYYFH